MEMKSQYGIVEPDARPHFFCTCAESCRIALKVLVTGHCFFTFKLRDVGWLVECLERGRLQYVQRLVQLRAPSH